MLTSPAPQAGAGFFEGSAMVPSELFKELYAECEATDDWLAVFGPAKGPFFVAPFDTAWWEPLEGQADVYFRTCPIDRMPAKKARGASSFTVSLPFVWLDVDCGKHKSGKNYFRDKEEARVWIDNYIPWTCLVDSGRGWHVYCVLEKPIDTTTPEGMQAAYDISARFQLWAREQCPYDIDSTHDLARVLRVPGTVHGSTSSTVLLKEIRCGSRLSPEMAASLPVRGTLPPPMDTESQHGTDHGFTLNQDCTLNTTLLLQLSTTNPNFTATWMGSRQPKGSDNSVSTWRFSMISFLTQAGLCKQDIVDLTIRFLIDQRGFSPDQLKLDRPGLWATEIMKCKTSEINQDEIQELIQDGNREEQVATIAGLMEFPDTTALLNVTRYSVMSGENNIRDMVISLNMRDIMGREVSVKLPDPMNRTMCTKHIFNMTGWAFPHYATRQAMEPNEKWRRAAQIAWGMALELEGLEYDAASQLLRSITEYVNSTDQANSLDETRETGRVYLDGDVYVIPTASLNAKATAEYPDLRSNVTMHEAVLELGKVGVHKVKQVYKGVRMACLLVPVSMVEKAG